MPGVNFAQRSGRVTVFTESSPVVKQPQRLYIEHDAKHPRLVMPMRNAGEGVAILTQEFPIPVETCAEDAIARTAPSKEELERQGLFGRLSFYVIRPGESEQLAYRPTENNYPELIEKYRKAADAAEVNLILRYTELLTRKLRWTCVRYTRSKPKNPNTPPRGGWSASDALYGEE